MTEKTTGEGMLVSPHAMREFIRLSKPSVFLLHNAAWRAGYTVNGISAE